jgi:hypothetical protein
MLMAGRPKVEDRLSEDEARVFWALARGAIALSGKTSAAIAKAAGMTEPTVRKIAGKSYTPSRAAAEKLIAGFSKVGVDVDVERKTLTLKIVPKHVATKFARDEAKAAKKRRKTMASKQAAKKP